MKTTKIATLAIILSLVPMACSDFLEDTARTNITTTFLYTTPSGLKSAVTGLYATERDYYSVASESAIALANVTMTDLAVTNFGTVFNFHSHREIHPDGWGGGQIARNWKLWYKIIDRANNIIEAAEVIEGMDEQERLQVLGEARTSRAHAYFNLFRWFHNIYINNVATTPENVFDIEFILATEEEIYATIEADLDFAIENLPWVTEHIGKYTQGTARHIRAKVAMFKRDWAEAAAQADKIIEEGPYQLLVNPIDVFATDLDGNHAESIHTVQFNEEAVGGGNFHWYSPHFTPLYYFPFVEGMRKDESIGGRAWGRIFPNDYLLSLYGKDNPGVDEDDKRWNDFYHHKYFYNDPETLPDGFNIGDEVMAFDKFGSDGEQRSYYSRTHQYTTKYNDSNRDPESLFSWKNIIVYRLAETYLIGAEAYMELGDNGKAFAYLDVVRQRAGLTSTPAVVTQNLILEERARELAFEGQRWFTLKRMGILFIRIRDFISDPTYFNNIARDNVQPHHVNWPIPQSELDKMGDFPQNDGY